MTHKSTSFQRLGAIVMSVSVLLIATACADTSSQPRSGNSTAVNETAVHKALTKTKQLRMPQKPQAPGPAFDATAASGKTLWVIDLDSSIPLVEATDKAAGAALGLVGAQIKRFDAKGQVSEMARGINQAIAAHADGIALFAINPRVVSGPLQDVAKAGIPVIAIQFGDPGAPLPQNVTAQVTYCYSCAGAAMANWILADSKGKSVGINFLVSKEVSNSPFIAGAFEKTIKQGCPGCDLKVDNVPVSDWQTTIPTLVKSTITSNPDMRYVVPIYDGMAIFAIPSVETSGRDDVQIVTFNASPDVMTNLKAGKSVTAELGSPQEWEGWALADQFMRLVTGNDPVEDEKVALRMFDKTNIDSIDLSAPESEWYQVDFKSTYKQTWGLE